MTDQRVATDIAESDDVDELRAEIARLRALLGPGEEAYTKLRLDLLAARDAARGAEAELGALKGYNGALEAEVVRLQRDFVWFRDRFVSQIKRVGRSKPSVGRAITRLSR